MNPLSSQNLKKLHRASFSNAMLQAATCDQELDKCHGARGQVRNEPEIGEINSDPEVDDASGKPSHLASYVRRLNRLKKDDCSHIFGSLLDLTHKLRETDIRYQKIVRQMEIENEISNCNTPLSNGILSGPSTFVSQSSSVTKPMPSSVIISSSMRDAVLPIQQYPEDFSSTRASEASSTLSNGMDLLGKSMSKMQEYSNGVFSSFSIANDHQQLQMFGFNGGNILPRMQSNVNPSLIVPSAATEQKSNSVLLERRKHHCQMCTYQTDNISHLRRHQCTVHNADKLYHCYVCGMDFSRSERAKAHFLTIHPEIPYHSKIARKRPNDFIEIPVATKSVKVKDNFRVPERMILPKPENATIAVKKSWEKYCRLVAPKDSSSNYHFGCLQCDYQGPNIWLLKRHYLDTHVSSGSYSCRVCHYSTGDMQRLISHMTGHGELFCSRCSFSTVELERFRAHLPLCNGSTTGLNELSQCPVCGEEFMDRLSVKSHVSHSHQREYCDLCGCVIYGPETMEEHLENHNNSDLNDSVSDRYTGDGGANGVRGANSNNSGSLAASKSNGAENTVDRADAEGQMTDELQQAKIRFGRFSNQVYYCPVDGCGFKATWKKSVELHTANYHGCGSTEEHADNSQLMLDQSGTGGVPSMYGLFNCAFCPNHRTFKYRKSFEKHLLQHGIDYEKHPYLVVRCSQLDASGGPSADTIST